MTSNEARVDATVRAGGAFPLARLRADAQAIARAAIDAVRADVLLARALASWTDRPARCVAIAVGKAAGAMMQACLDAGVDVARGMVATTHVRGSFPPAIDLHLAGHPIPTEASQRAAARAFALVTDASPDDLVLVLLSGGASALMAAPAAGLTLADKMHATRVLLEAGAAIHELNGVRKHLSAVKGGRLAAAARGRILTWALSDVVGPIEDDPGVIGSGPTAADETTFGDALAIIDRLGVRGRLPSSIVAALEAGARGARPDTPKAGDPRLARSRFDVIGGRRHAMAGAAAAARRLGYAVITVDDPIIGEARHAGPALLAHARALVRDAPRPACVIASGETTVHVRGRGTGGRNQELALAAALRLADTGADTRTGEEPATVLLSIGTDGIDGPTDAAGALVDPTTVARARAHGLGDLQSFLDNNDAWHAFDRLGDLLRCGRTDTNVGDVQILLFGH